MPVKRYTIRELADELNVTKPGIRKLLTEEFRKQYTETAGNRILINNSGAEVIRQHFENSVSGNKSKTKTETNENNQKQSKTVSDSADNAVIKAKQETIKLLKEQLKAKDDQIANMQKLMDQNQQLLLNTQAENKQLLALTHKTSNNDVKDGEYQEAVIKNGSASTSTESKEDEEVQYGTQDEKKTWWKFW